MRRVIPLLFLAFLLAACGGGPSLPGTKPPTPEPGDFFTGEPTSLVVRITDRSIAPSSSMRLMSTNNDGSHVIVIGTPLYNEAGHAVNTRFSTVEVSPEQSFTTLALEIPALQNHNVTAVRLENNRLVSFGRNVVDTPIGVTSYADVDLIGPDHTIRWSDPLHANTEVRANVHVEAHNPPGTAMLYADVLIGMQPWTENGAKSMYDANEPDETWHTGIPRQFFADVDVPTTLYYQVRSCVGRGYLPPEHQEAELCSYHPDLEAGQPLQTVTLHPEPAE